MGARASSASGAATTTAACNNGSSGGGVRWVWAFGYVYGDGLCLRGRVGSGDGGGGQSWEQRPGADGTEKVAAARWLQG